MQPVLRRIALHGGLTAFLLAVVGFMFAELASIWLAGSPGTRAATGDPVAAPDEDGATAASLRSRVPLLMAVWGFAFVAVGELALYYWRGVKLSKAPPVAPPDETQKLLADLLREAEARVTNRDEAVASSVSRPDNTPGFDPTQPPGERGA